MNKFRTLISAAELRTAVDEQSRDPGAPAALVVLDCRATLGDPAAGPASWARGHLPLAQHANLETDLAAPAHSVGANGGGRHPLPDRDKLIACCSRWGIGNTTQVVAYDDAGGAYAARAWWLLRWLGHEAVAVLDGGIAAWQKLPNTRLTSQSEPVASASFEAKKSLCRIADLAEVARVAQQPGSRLLDARAQARFDGEVEPIDPVAGHIPGAHCFFHAGNLGDDGLFLSPEKLADRFGQSDTEVICYCGSGVTATHNVLAMNIAGLPEPKLYVGSWSEWCSDPERPREPATAQTDTNE